MGLFGRKKPKADSRFIEERETVRQESFKCPFCFEKIFEKGVAFRAMTAYTPQDLEDFQGEDLERKSQYLLKTDELYERFWNRYPGSKPEDSGRNRTYERHPVISQHDARFLTNSRLTDGSRLVFREDEDGFLNEVIDTEGNVSKIRICPHCHNRLPFEFGKYPVKYISVVGITSSGKTVYLSQLLGKINEILIRAGMTVAGLCPEVDEFVRAHTIRRGLILPGGNATNVLTTPIPVNVMSKRDGRRYTLVFYDIAGENCVDPGQMEKYGGFIRNADGIIMIMDPRQFTDLIYLGEDDEEAADEAYSPEKVVAAMYTAFVSADSAGGKSDIPLAATLSKNDLLKGTEVIGGNSNIFRKIAYEEYYPEKGFPYNDYIVVDSEVKRLLKKSIKGEILADQLNQFFPDHSYFSFSALNGTPILSKEGSVRRYQMEVNPEAIRVEEPLLWLLYRLGMIDRMEKRGRRG